MCSTRSVGGRGPREDTVAQSAGDARGVFHTPSSSTTRDPASDRTAPTSRRCAADGSAGRAPAADDDPRGVRGRRGLTGWRIRSVGCGQRAGRRRIRAVASPQIVAAGDLAAFTARVDHDARDIAPFARAVELDATPAAPFARRRAPVHEDFGLSAIARGAPLQDSRLWAALSASLCRRWAMFAAGVVARRRDARRSRAAGRRSVRSCAVRTPPRRRWARARACRAGDGRGLAGRGWARARRRSAATGSGRKPATAAAGGGPRGARARRWRRRPRSTATSAARAPRCAPRRPSSRASGPARTSWAAAADPAR